MRSYIPKLIVPFASLVSVNLYASDNSVLGCTPVQQEVCVLSGQQMVAGELETRDCWSKTSVWACEDRVDAGDCKPFAESGCVEGAEVCTETSNGKCVEWKRNYTCEDGQGPASTEQCESVTYCENADGTEGVCYDMSSEADKDMPAVLALLEAGRQAGTYMTDSLFAGQSYHCRLPFGGFGQSCCFVGKQKGNMFTNAAMTAAGFMGGGGTDPVNYIKQGATSYVKDAMFGGSFLSGGMSFINPLQSFSFNGLGMSGGMMGAFQFNPATFALSVAINVVLAAIMCAPNEAEIKLGQLRKDNLCKEIGSYCSKKKLGVCLRKKRSYCCWNSTLAKIIAMEGRTQLQKQGINKNWGSAKSPNCSGFTKDQFTKLDLGKMDFSEFYQQIKVDNVSKASGRTENADFWTERAENRVDTAFSNSDTSDKDYSQKMADVKSSIEKKGNTALSGLDTSYAEGTVLKEMRIETPDIATYDEKGNLQ